MIRAPRVLLAVLAATAGAAAQERASLSAVWLAEHLRHTPRGGLVAAYERVLADERAPVDERGIAAARLLEIDRVSGDEAAIERHLVALRDALGTDDSGQGVSALDIDREALRAALREPPGPLRDEELARARARIEEQLRESRAVSRSFVWIIARRLSADRDAERARIERELAAARAAGRTDRIRELENQLRESRGSTRSTDVDRLRAWRIRLVRLLTEGRFDQAQVLRDRLPAPDPAPGDDGPEARLRETVADPELSAQERAVLGELLAKIEEWRRDGRRDAERALQLLPY